MPFQDDASFYSAASLAEALSALHERGCDGQAIAGGTWVMRAELRGESQERAYVSLARLEELRGVSSNAAKVDIGACVTHAQLAVALQSETAYRGLATAASHSANPAIRNVATVGGNLCAAGFAAADLVPALIALGARVEVDAIAGVETMSVEDFVNLRGRLEPGRIVRRVILPREASSSMISAHVRLPLRKAGDYPVAIVSIAVLMKPNRTVDSIRVAVGSVEATPRRWPGLEADLIGRALKPSVAIRLADTHVTDFLGRDGAEAPGWYRVKVLPTLVGRAVEQLAVQ